MPVFFYKMDANLASLRDPNPLIDVRFWQPTTVSLAPPDLPRNVVAWQAALQYRILHALRIFHNDRYSVCSIYIDGKLAHMSFIYPGYFRFPFMGPNDLQIGATWTDPRYRGKGLASEAILAIVGRFREEKSEFWYLTHSENLPSIRAIEKAGFFKVGEGRVKKRLNLNLLGSYEIKTSDADETAGSVHIR